MNAITSSDALSAHVRGYAQAVRLHLTDLGQDVVDDLTDGLEANLTEAVLDEAAVLSDDVGTQAFDLAARFGPADEYATELRTAAGLPPAAAAGRARRGPVRVIGEAWATVSVRWQEAWRPLTSTPGWAAFAEFVRSLAPAWWILRGWVAAQIVMWPFGMSGVTLWPASTAGRVLMVAGIVVSVQWGRGRWVPRWTWFPRAVALASVAAGVLAIPMVADVAAETRPYTGQASSYDAGWNDGFYNAQVSQVDAGDRAATDGVWVDGMQVSNIFAYDAAGDPIRDVQLYDDRGRPVRTIAAQATWDTWAVPDFPGSWSFQPAIASDGRTRWNVYPLSAVPAEQVGVVDEGGDFYDRDFYDNGEQEYPDPPTGVQPQEMPWPFLKAPTAIEGNAAAGSDESTDTEEPAQGPPGGDRPMSRTDGETVHPGERPTSGGGFPEPSLEATQAD